MVTVIQHSNEKTREESNERGGEMDGREKKGIDFLKKLSARKMIWLLGHRLTAWYSQ